MDVGHSVAQYSRLVARLKIGLPVAAGLILLLVLVLPQFRSESDRFRIGLKSVGDVVNDTLSMRNARYFGTDDKGQPYQVTAATVHERSEVDANGTKLIDLTEPQVLTLIEVAVGGFQDAMHATAKNDPMEVPF